MENNGIHLLLVYYTKSPYNNTDFILTYDTSSENPYSKPLD